MRVALIAAVASLASLTPAPPAQQISVDVSTNSSAQHETAVEPDSFAFGRNVVSVFQLGRIVGGGASGIGWATSLDGGETWRSGVLPGLATRVSDPVVAYDRVHDVWLAGALALRDVTAEPLSAIVVSRSRNGLSWSDPIVVAREEGRFNHDKPWLVCDNGASSPFSGRCYAAWTTRPGNNGVLALASSTDGGASWGVPVVVSQARGSGWQPLTQPNGSLVIPYEGEREVNAVVSRDGGRSFGAATRVAALRATGVPGMRAPALPSAERDGAGRIYVAWQDSRFRGGRVNDIVFASSTDGSRWSRVRRVPTWPDLDGLTHFVPGLAVGGGRVAIAFYVLSSDGVAPMFVSSADGGRTWGEPRTLAAPQPITAYPQSNEGRFLGDYISTSLTDAGVAVPTFAAASAPFDGRFHQGVFATRIAPLASRGALLRLGAPKVVRGGSRVTATIPILGPARPTRVSCQAPARLVATRVLRTKVQCVWRVRVRGRIKGVVTVLSAEEEARRSFTR